MTSISANIHAVRERIDKACAAAQREAREITLLAVSKTFGAQAVEEAATAGQRAFGENYIQEAVDKMALLPHLPLEVFQRTLPEAATASPGGKSNLPDMHGLQGLPDMPDMPILAICNRSSVEQASPSARALGVHAGQKRATALAPAPALIIRERDPAR